MAPRNPWEMLGNGILSGVTLGTTPSATDDPDGADPSQWASALRRSWDSAGTASYGQYQPPQLYGVAPLSGGSYGLPALDQKPLPLFSGTGKGQPLAQAAGGPNFMFSAQQSNSGIGGLSGLPSATFAAGLPSHLASSPPVLPASYQNGAVRPWWAPASPPGMFDPWVDSAIQSIRSTINHFRQGGGSTTSGSDRDSPECRQEWQDAREMCARELAKPNPARNITGGYDDVEECARGHVSEECGGNYYQRSPEPRTRPYRPR
jgi:hypothetical protein